MNFPFRLLWINAMLFVLFGVGFIVAPRSLSLLITDATRLACVRADPYLFVPSLLRKRDFRKSLLGIEEPHTVAHRLSAAGGTAPPRGRRRHSG